ncbi:MAG: alpha-L-fucosidase, partial [bacterium]|nr:alpha-L-fucosidase [bacterium]
MRAYFIVFVLGFGLLSCAGEPAAEPAPQAISFTGDIAQDLATVDEVVAAGPFQAQWESLEENGMAEWSEDAELGILIRWGVYSVPALGNGWYPRNMYTDKMDQRRKVT